MPIFYNVSSGLTECAARAPYRPGIIFPAGRDLAGRSKFTQFSFQQLEAEVNAYAHGLHDFGVQMGERVLLMVRPGVELIAVTFALVRLGAVPVIIDPGMGRRAFLQCVAETEPALLIGIPLAHVLRRLVPRPFATVRRSIVVGEPTWLGDTALAALRREGCAQGRDPFPCAPTTTESEAAVAFTSGSTGVPKGVVYLHGMFQAQIALMRDELHIKEGEVDLALLYIFAMFNPALGVTTVIPDMDPTKSAQVNPAHIVEAILTHGVTNAFGSPTIWKRVVPYCQERGIRLPSLRRVLMASAPVPPSLVRALLEDVLSPGASVNTPFGATEAMPLTFMDGRELVEETAARSANGGGTCVGRPLPGITLRVIRITDEAIPTWDESLVLPQGAIGEIVVKGPVVTRTYLNRPQKTAEAKIQEGEDTLWHRMGDVGYFDAEGRLWFCGRKAHRVETTQGTLFPVPCESIFNQHSDVVRTALVGAGPRGRQIPILVVEPLPGKAPRSNAERVRFTEDLLALGAAHAHTRTIGEVFFYPGIFPTDIRHNAKIQREKLAEWVGRIVGKGEVEGQRR
ncbi:MAG: Tyrocidine synthase 3 [Chloroflexi bacterium ADurb.Bin360]|nr:MAG: Tyrocidine synthase 3 [Chloroflexi bacterium ADurb.Bin360]